MLVVGAGPVAHEKIEGLLDCGARVTVVAPQVSEPVEQLARQRRVALIRGHYQERDLQGRLLVIAATSDTTLNTRIHAHAEQRSMLCNVVDVPELCSFILPALHRHDPITIAVSTGGASPALAQRLRDDIARIVRPEHAELARQLRDIRPWAKAQYPTYRQRRAFFQQLVEERLG